MNNQINIGKVLLIFFLAICIFGFKPDYIKAQESSLDAVGQNKESSIDRKSSEIWQSLPPEKKQEIRERYKKFKNLPQEERDRIKKKLLKFGKLTPEQKEKARRNFKKIRDLSPEERRALLRKYKRWQNLSDEEKKRIISKHEMLKRMPAQERQQLLRKKEKWQDLSPEKKRKLKDDYFKEHGNSRDAEKGKADVFRTEHRGKGGRTHSPQGGGRRGKR